MKTMDVLEEFCDQKVQVRPFFKILFHYLWSHHDA